MHQDKGPIAWNFYPRGAQVIFNPIFFLPTVKLMVEIVLT